MHFKHLSNTSKTVIALIAAALVIVGIFLLPKGSGNVPDGTYDTLAQCIADSGAKFYGAFWCPHCQNQKKMFGDSQKLLPYVECSTPDQQGRTQVCIDNNIESYPTWVFTDGSRLQGEIPLSTLAEKTSCELPA